MYGLKQAGIMWGYVLVKALVSWGFKKLSVDSRVLLKESSGSSVAVLIVVDDLLFVYNSHPLLGHLEEGLIASCEVKLFGKLSSLRNHGTLLRCLNDKAL